jgi:DNA-binding ferritin-like protein
MEQILQRLLARQEQMLAEMKTEMKASQEKMDVNTDAIQERP